jgi:hypothetical protein
MCVSGICVREITPGTPHISIWSGNGLAVAPQLPPGEPSVVLVQNEAGQPMSGAPVTWEIVEGANAFGLYAPMPVTARGFARTEIRCETTLYPMSSVSTTVRVSVAGGSVDLKATCFSAPPNFPPSAPAIYVVTPRDLGSGSAGQILPGAIQVTVNNQFGGEVGRPAPNIGFRIMAAGTLDDSVTPPVRCLGDTFGRGIVMTGPNGIGTCDLLLGNATGATTFRVWVGGSLYFDPFYIRIQ